MFFIFWSRKIRVSPTDFISSLSPPRCRLSSVWRHHATAPCHTSSPLRQDELTVSASYSGNALSRCLPSQIEIEALNPHHRRRLPSPNRLTPILYCYKNIISTLITLPTTQSRHHFASSLARAQWHQSSHSLPSFPFTVVSCPWSIRTMTHTMMN
jgi:hypothetical protein